MEKGKEKEGFIIVGTVFLQHTAVVFPHLVLFADQPLGFLHGASFELYLLSGAELGKEGNIDIDDRGDFGVAACSLPVCHHHDRLSGAGDLHAPVYDSVREDVVAAGGFNRSAGSPSGRCGR